MSTLPHATAAAEAANLIDRERLASTLAQLIEAPSVNPFGRTPGDGEGETAAAAYIRERLTALDWSSQEVEFAPGRPSVFARAGDTPKVVLAGHLDTVGVDEYTQPFAAVREGNRIHGRGACDMKAAVACYLEVAEVLSVQGVDAAIGIAAVADEEHEQRGAKAVRELTQNAELVVIGEPTELRICAASKGLAAFTLHVDGVATHGSVPGAGVNAIERAAELVTALRGHAEELAATTHPLLGHAVVNVGVIRGGSKPNVVPPSCEVDLSRRLLPGETADGARAAIARTLRDRCGPEGWSLSESWWTVDAYENRDAIVDAFCGAAARAGLHETDVSGFPGSSDAPYFGAPVVICGPGSLNQAHSLDEWVELDDMVAATRTYLQFIHERLAADERS